VYLDSDERRELVAKHLDGKIENVEVRWKRNDQKIITVRLSGRAVRKATGEFDSFEMIAEDVTERRNLEDQLRQSQKMEAVGRLAGGVAHDFNNLLTVIKGYTELMLEEFREHDPLRGELEEIRKAADRASALTRQLLAFSRQQVLAPKVLDLNHVVTNMDKLLRRLLGADVELTTKLDPTIGRIKADPGQLEQVIMNLAVNARDAMPVGGKLLIETGNVDLDESFAREHVGAKPGSFVMVAVSDNGAGMSETVRQRIFEPFFTTKEAGKGTGLGLSTVYGIVKQSGGYIWVYSEMGKGTTFKVYLPRVDARVDASIPAQMLPQTAFGRETVLLVEDEDGVRALVRQVLHKHGYNVLEARHGGEALLHCERHKGDIELLLTDVVLEQMGGPELAKRLLGIRPEMRVLYISGYTDDAVIHHGVSTGTAFLQKPFTTDALAKKVREVLDRVPQI
jgi:two-component system, cell cycle sensor histidine kinase and response regulator CckA